MDKYQLHIGDALTILKTMPDQYVNCWVTSPPYWGLRDYGVDGQLGLERTPDEYVAKMVEIFREARRVLRDDGTLWLNLGDTYNNCDKWGGGGANTGKHTRAPNGDIESWKAVRRKWDKLPDIKPKDLVGIPWMVAFALRSDGWYLRQEIIWNKPNCMPESVKDRCTKSHEHIFLLSKSERYHFDQDAIKEPASPDTYARYARYRSDTHKWADGGPGNQTIAKSFEHMKRSGNKGRNKRSVWTVSTKPFAQAHFATFPPDLIEPCILAGCPEGGVVGDMFAGSGTTGEVALRHFRRFVGIELNPTYANEIATPRIEREAGRPKQMTII